MKANSRGGSIFPDRRLPFDMLIARVGDPARRQPPRREWTIEAHPEPRAEFLESSMARQTLSIGAFNSIVFSIRSAISATSWLPIWCSSGGPMAIQMVAFVEALRPRPACAPAEPPGPYCGMRSLATARPPAMKTIAPFGAWVSPVTTGLMTAAAVGLSALSAMATTSTGSKGAPGMRPHRSLPAERADGAVAELRPRRSMSAAACTNTAAAPCRRTRRHRL